MIIKIDYTNSNKKGVYKITNNKSNKYYIGSTTQSFKSRCSQHLYELNSNIHCNTHLQRSFNKYGSKTFSFEILEICEKEQCVIKEQYWMDYYKSYDHKKGYNILKYSNNSLGYKHTPETLIRMSKLKKEKPSHINTQKAVLLANIGRPKSLETRLKISNSNKGRIHSPESIEKRRIQLLGKSLKNKRNIIKMNYDYTIIKIYESLKECSNDINISMSQIRGICNGRSIQPLNYLLMYDSYEIKSNRTSRKIEIKWRK